MNLTGVRYLTAAQWGMRWNGAPIAERTPDGECYVHHTAGALISPDAATAFRGTNEYAITSKGYRALDYDVLVHYDPTRGVLTIGEGRGGYMSAATLDRNEEGEAVCVMGYFHPGHQLSRQPFPEEIEGVALAIKYGIDRGWLTRDTSIVGHRDNPRHPNATACPGDDLYKHLPTIRARVAQLLTPPPEVPMFKYFKLSSSPGTLWQEIAPGVAVRVDPECLAGRGGFPVDVPTLSPAQASAFMFYTGGLPSLSVR